MDSEDRSLVLGIVRWLPASSLSQIHVACSTMKTSSFPLEIEKNIQATKSYRFFTVAANPDRDQRNLRRLPDFRFSQISPLLWSFSRFWSSFIAIEVSNEEEYSILRILYCYSLQQHVFIAFNDFDAHYRVLAYIFLRYTTLLFSKWRQKPTRPILRYSTVVNMEMCKIINFENS